MATQIPTSLRGYTTDAVYYGGMFTDVLEHIPDLAYPLSVPVYGRMRTEGAIAAVLAAYTLPIRRATWTINPAGCRPEVVQMVADDLGLPVAGKDEPGAARTRGVSWAEHLRCALSYLTFGHSAFELQAEMRDGQARLVGLHERLQSTIQEIHVDRQGQLLGISQELVARKSRPQIPADRMCFYSHDREGANWAGRALIRPAYPYWLIKQEMIRTHSVANRRWGAGVPVMEALPGTAPSPAQMAEAMQMAASARAGEQAGAATPPGFVMKILGLSGAVPDTLGFLRWLDQQLSRFALAGFLDLGSSETGSRALGQSFIDLFLLNASTIGIATADTATRQVAARIVEWNFGDSEPVPAVEVNDIGTKHDITAEALNLLLNSGALSSDPGLEAHIRRMFKLPERVETAAPTGRAYEFDIANGVVTPNERRAQIGLPPVAGGDTLRDPNAPAQPFADRSSTAPLEPKVAAKRKPQAAGQLELPIAAASDDDEARRVQAQYEAALAALLAGWPLLAGPLVDDLVRQVEAAAVTGLTAVAASAAVVDAIAAELEAAMTALAGQAAAQVAEQAAAQGVTVDQSQPDASRLAEIAAVTAGLIAGGYTSAAVRRAVLAPAGAAGGMVRAALDDMTGAQRGVVADNLGAALSTAQGHGRLAVMASAVAWVGTESAEAANRCAACTAANGRRYDSLAEALRDRPTGGQLAACAGRGRCRGALLPIWR